MIARSWRWSALGMPVAVLMAFAILALAASAPIISAQDDEPPHPGHIHEGSCAELGDVVHPLQDIAPITGGENLGARSAVPVEASTTEVDVPLGDLLTSPFAINLHRSAQAIQDYIACGDVGGRVVDGELVIGLQEVDDSGYSGVARLQEDGDTTVVTVYLIAEAAAGEQAAGTPAAGGTEDETPTAEAEAETPTAEPEADEETPTAEAEAPAGQEVAVDIRDFSYNPDPIEINVGDTITWTNQDGVPDTATARNRDVLQSGPIAPGESFSQTFEEAGEFPYFCEFHAGMAGTILVE